MQHELRANQSRLLISHQSDRSETTDYEKYALPLDLEIFHAIATYVRAPVARSSGFATARVFIYIQVRERACTRVHRHEEASALVQRAALISRSGSLAALMTRRVIRKPLQIYRYRSAIFVAFAAIHLKIRYGKSILN